jgi:hypothetical protein
MRIYVPSDPLICRYAFRYGWEPAKLTAVLARFGRLSEVEQEQLIHCLVQAFGPYQMRAKSVGRVTPSKLRNQVASLQTTARKLLHQLGLNPKAVTGDALRGLLSAGPSSERARLLRLQNKGGMHLMDQLAFAGINTTDKGMASVNTELQKASHRVMGIVFALLELHERAKIAAEEASKRVALGRGGSRHRLTAKGQLTRDAITIYAHMRKQYPGSGNKPGYGGPMLRFVHGVAELYGVRIRDADVYDAWRKSKRK